MQYYVLFDDKREYTKLPYEIIRSKRKTMGLQVGSGGRITVRIPQRVSLDEVFLFVDEHKDWIYKAYLKQKDRPDIDAKRKAEKADPANAALEKKYRAMAKQYIYERVEHFLPITGGHYSKIRIGDQKTRWGSCSADKVLSFSWRLVLAPPEVLDYVVIHELCHLTQMDHSPAFWNKVALADPDYRAHRKWLKDNADTLILNGEKG